MHSIRRMMRFLKPYWKSTVLAIFMLMAVVTADLIIPRLVQRIVDEGIVPGDMTIVINTTLIMLGVSLISALMTLCNTMLSVRVAQNFAADLRSEVFRKIQTFSFGNLDRLQTGQLMIRMTSDISQEQQIVLMSMRMLTRGPVMFLGSIIMMVTTNPRLSLIMAALLPPAIGIVWFFVKKAQPLFLEVQQKLGKLNTILQENLAGAEVVKAFVRTEHENERFKRVNVSLTTKSIQVMQFLAVLMPTMLFMLNLGMVGVLWFGGVQIIDGTFTIGELMAFVNYLLATIFPLLLLSMAVGLFSAAEASAGRIFEILDSTAEVKEQQHACTLSSVKGRVVFENVTFSYGGNSHESVLKGIDLVAEPGEIVAILGATGAGKSSLVNLIPRFYDVTDGRVTLDGVDVRELTLDNLRAQIGIALQEAVLFSGTIHDNICYGKPDATDDEVIAAAKAAQAHDFIMDTQEGYDSLIGQRGVNLSGGQKQRIAIARALLVQPSVLILDDSTSSVDVDTEAKIQTAVEDLMANRTSFIIAQRISTVLDADKIIVLDKGKIAAMGTHAELMSYSPIYQEIYQSQLGDGRGRNA